MQGYYVAAEDTSADLDWDATMAYVADMKRYPVQPMTLKDCGNPLCCHQSYAVYCSTYCLEAVEGTEEPAEADDYYHSDDITLGHIITADAQHQADLAAGGFAALACGVQPICIKASYLPYNHDLRLRECPPCSTHSPQVIGDSSDVFFFVYTTPSGELA